MTTSRQLILKTLEFDSPHRIPRQLWYLPWAADHYPAELSRIQEHFPDDMVGAPSFFRQAPRTVGGAYDVGVYVDEWGCIFQNLQKGVIGEVKTPVVQTWDDLDKVRPPEEALSIDVDQVNAFCRSTDKFVMSGCCARPFERLQFLRRSDNVYIDLAEQTPEIFQLIDKIHQFYLKEMELWATTEVDGLSFMDDWGSQRALLISPRQWRQIFKPLYKDYIDIAHSHGKKIFMHSDGYTAAIIPDLIELGLDALNTQLFVMNIEDLGQRFAGQITFWGELDRQWLLPHATTAEIDAAVRRVHAAFWRSGGAIAQCEFGAGSKPENVWQMFQTWDELSG